MAIKIPGDSIPDSTNLPDGIFDFRGESLEPVETTTGKLAIKAALRVIAPKSHKGLVHYEQFTIGSNDDPQAREAETWASSFGAVQCKKMVTKSGVKFTGELQTVAREWEGQKVSGRVVYTVQPKFNKDGTENPFAGNARSQVKEWFEIGEKVATADAASIAGKATATPKKAPKAAAPPPPSDDDDDEDEEEEPAPKRESKSRTRQPVAANGGDDDDEDDD